MAPALAVELVAALAGVWEAALVVGMEAVLVVFWLAAQVAMMGALMMAERVLSQLGLSLEVLGVAACLFPYPSSLKRLWHQTNYLLRRGSEELAAIQV